MRTFYPGLITILSLLFLSSCLSNRKIARLNQSIEYGRQQENKLDSTLRLLNNFREQKNAIGELDDTSSLSIKKILDLEISAAKARTDSLNKMQEKLSGKRIKKKEYYSMVSVVSLDSSIISTRMETVAFVDELLKQQTFIRFNSAAFFPPGGYDIPEDKIPLAKTAFAPIIDSLIEFVKRFPKFNLLPSIISNGYADGQGYSPGPLVDTLTVYLGKTEATKEELNQELSLLRAREIAGVLQEILKEKMQNLAPEFSLNTHFYITGKGEEYPNKKINDYQVDDERRRIVIIYWNALPGEK